MLVRLHHSRANAWHIMTEVVEGKSRGSHVILFSHNTAAKAGNAEVSKTYLHMYVRTYLQITVHAQTLFILSVYINES